MGHGQPPQKTPELLDAMLDHVAYEVTQITNFLRVGNTWLPEIRPDLQQFGQQSILEAGLIHLRCVYEFLNEPRKGDQVRAYDYIPDWKRLKRLQGMKGPVNALDSRVAHIGIDRVSVSTEGAFIWNDWLDATAPIIVGAFDEFLLRLRDASPGRFERISAELGPDAAQNFPRAFTG